MKTEQVIVSDPLDLSTYEEVSVQTVKGMHMVGRMAGAMCERLMLVAAFPDGEDSAGRQKLRLPTAEEAATRACDLAAALYAECDRRGWVYDIPVPRKISET